MYDEIEILNHTDLSMLPVGVELASQEEGKRTLIIGWDDQIEMFKNISDSKKKRKVVILAEVTEDGKTLIDIDQEEV